MTGGAPVIVKVAALLVVLPAIFATMQVKSEPSSLEKLVGGVVYVLPVAPSIVAPFFLH
jgi:hypothetical protein